MFKAEWINFKIWDLCSFVKVVIVNLRQVIELNLHKGPMDSVYAAVALAEI